MRWRWVIQGLVICGIGVLLLIMGLTIHGHRIMHQEMKRQTLGEGAYLLPHPTLGLVPRPSSTFTHAQVTKDPADSIVRYTMNADAQRITPRVDAPEGHLMLFGCSYTFGQGLQDTVRVGWSLAERWPSIQVHDLSFMGFSPQQTVDIIESSRLPSGIRPEDEVVGLFLFTENHSNSALGDPFSLRWLYSSSRYVMDHGRAIRRGSFVRTAPVRTGLTKGLQDLGLDGGAAIVQAITSIGRSKDHGSELVASMCVRMQRSFRRRFPNGRFFVVIFPEERTEIVEHLERSGVPVIDLRDAACLSACDGRQADGYHPNETGARAVSDAIIDALEAEIPAHGRSPSTKDG